MVGLMGSCSISGDDTAITPILPLTDERTRLSVTRANYSRRIPSWFSIDGESPKNPASVARERRFSENNPRAFPLVPQRIRLTEETPEEISCRFMIDPGRFLRGYGRT